MMVCRSSSGTLLAAALRHCRDQDRPQRVVTLVCDSGAKYFSKVFNPVYAAQEGGDYERQGRVRDGHLNIADATSERSSARDRSGCRSTRAKIYCMASRLRLAYDPGQQCMRKLAPDRRADLSYFFCRPDPR
jgi:hypothetical protein